jgi:hypothetical protein
MYGTHTLAFQRIFVRMKIIALIFIRFSYDSLIRNSVTGPLRNCVNMLISLLQACCEKSISQVDVTELCQHVNKLATSLLRKIYFTS